MDTNKLAYLVALFVLAFGLTSEYQKGNFPTVHRALGRAENSLCRLVTRAERTVAVAQVLIGREPQQFQADSELLARQQGEVERVLAEHQADFERAAAEQQAVLDHAMADHEAALGCARQRLDRMQIALDRAQLQRTRALERMRFKLSSAADRRIIVVCPRTGARIVVHTGADLSRLDTELSNMNLGNSF